MTADRRAAVVMVVSPRGDVIRNYRPEFVEHYRKHPEGIYGLVVDGELPDGTVVSVRGTHIALAWLEGGGDVARP